MSRALAFFAALVGCAPALSVGAPCTSAVDCPAPYVCELGACRSECRTDRDCVAGTTCVGAEGGGVCTLPSESACDRCPAPLVCTPATGCRAACSSDDDCLATQRCSATACIDRLDEDAPADAAAPDAAIDAAAPDAPAPVDAPSDVPPDAGSVYPAPELCTDDSVCETTELCSSDFDTPGVCRARCDAHSDCPGSACDAIGTRPELGCASLCVPGTQDGCPVGTSCRMTGYGGALPGGPGAVTLCSRFVPAGRGGHGCSCENLDDSHECGAGLSCEQPDRGRQCLTICRVGDVCPTGGVCEATLRSVLRAGVEWGVCPATSAPIACP